MGAIRLDADALLVSRVRSMRARNLSRRTLEAYTDSVKRLDDLDLDVDQVAYVTGKDPHQHACPFGNKTVQALDRYLRVRARHNRADDPKLWLPPLPGMITQGAADAGAAG